MADLGARVGRKLKRRIIPFVMLLYFVSFLDRVNVGFAAMSMNRAIGLSPAAFGFGGGLFFIGYVLFEIPSNLILHRVGAPRWIARVMVTWGLVAAASAFVAGPTSFYVLRFALGVAEAGFFPGIILYLSLWFPARQRAVAAAWFMAAAPLSTAIGAPISGAIMQLPPIAGLADWQMLYLIEAVPAVLLGIIVPWCLTGRPAQARWLEPEEREWLMARLSEDAVGSPAAGHTAVWGALRDSRVLTLAVIYFGTSAGLYTLGLWAPQMVQRYGFSPWETGLLTGVPGVLAIGAMLLWAAHSDRSAERSWHVAIPCLVACAGFVLAGRAQGVWPFILALIIVNVGISAAKPPLWAMPGAFLSGAGAAAGIAMINSIGNLGGFVGPYLIGRLKSADGYGAGLYLVGATLGLSALLTVWLGRGGAAVNRAA